MKKFGLYTLIATLITSIVLIACSKDKDATDNPTNLTIMLTDAPAAYDEVNVDIEQVKVKFRDGDDADTWVDLQTNAAIYDLLTLQNGVTTMLAAGTIPTNTVKEIRLVLGSDNTIIVDGVEYPLTIPSGSESGLKIKVNKSFDNSLETLLVDFDAALSIHQTGTGAYQLKPVLKLK